MTSKEEVDLGEYNPRQWKDVVAIEATVPERDFREGERGRWVVSLFGKGVIIINFVHKDHPDALCQVQCSPDEQGRYHTFFVHISPTKQYIPDGVAERMLAEAFPEVLEQLFGNQAG